MGLLSFALFYWLNDQMGLGQMHGSRSLSVISLIAGIVVTAVIVAWSLVALPPSQRGRELAKNGPFHYVRHPLYAAFLIGFNVGLAVFMDGWIFLVWAVLQYPLWSLNIAAEEHLMQQHFGQAYSDYCRTTGRFLPKRRALLT